MSRTFHNQGTVSNIIIDGIPIDFQRHHVFHTSLFNDFSFVGALGADPLRDGGCSPFATFMQ